MTLHYDLHSHSTASDGSLSPEALVERAAAQGVDVLALTDHDTTDGIAAARAAATATGLRLVAGVEVSVTWSHQTIHIVGLRVDPDDAALQAGLRRLGEFRRWRGEEIARRLGKAGIAGAYEGARAHAGGEILSRTHFARFLVESGHAPDVRRVFKRFLVSGRPGHVPGDWASLEEAVAWIRGAGGQAVLAHPARYRLSSGRRRQLIGEFRDCGGSGIEVVSGSHGPEDVRVMARFAEEFGLYASCGSDYHGPQNAYMELGSLPALPPGCRPIWESWSGAAEHAAAAGSRA